MEIFLVAAMILKLPDFSCQFSGPKFRAKTLPELEKFSQATASDCKEFLAMLRQTFGEAKLCGHAPKLVGFGGVRSQRAIS